MLEHRWRRVYSLTKENAIMVTENDDLTEQERALIAQFEDEQDSINAPSAWEYSQFF